VEIPGIGEKMVEKIHQSVAAYFEALETAATAAPEAAAVAEGDGVVTEEAAAAAGEEAALVDEATEEATEEIAAGEGEATPDAPPPNLEAEAEAVDEATEEATEEVREEEIGTSEEGAEQ
jgi:hypothetical protein